MKEARKLRHFARGLTLAEVLVTIGAVGLLSGLLGTVCVKARSFSRTTACLANQKAISQALVTYYGDKKELPADGTDLAVKLEDYISWPQTQRSVALPEVWRCPNDTSAPLTNSYEAFYVQRTEPQGSQCFVMGCPRHEDNCVSLKGTNLVERRQIGAVKINGSAAALDGTAEDRTLRTGTMALGDGTTATVTSSTSGYGVEVLASFWSSNGKLYSVVRVSGEGTTNFQVTPGSQFEVVTPVCIAGVRGTQFSVTTQTGYTHVDVTSGVVAVTNRATGQTQLLSAGEDAAVGEPGDDPPSNAKHLTLCFKNKKLWTITNTNKFKVTFTWQIVGTNRSGSATVKANKFKNVNVGVKNADSLKITYTLPGLGTVTTTGTRGGDDDDDDGDDD